MEKSGYKTPYLLLIFFLIVLVVGINIGEVEVVLEKAISICLSCIGIQ